jgi:hypothetical protein
MAVINPPERQLAKRTSVRYCDNGFISFACLKNNLLILKTMVGKVLNKKQNREIRVMSDSLRCFACLKNNNNVSIFVDFEKQTGNGSREGIK